MSKAIYISTTEKYSGKSLFVLGLMDFLLGKMGKVGYFRPIIDDQKNNVSDNHINTILSYFKINLKYEDTYAFTRSEILKLLKNKKNDDILDTIIKAYKNIEAQFDFIIIEGSDFSGDANINEFNLNVEIAKNLGIPVIIVSHAEQKTLQELSTTMQLAINTFKEKDVEVMAAIANKIEHHQLESYNTNIKRQLSDEVQVYTFPHQIEWEHQF